MFSSNELIYYLYVINTCKLYVINNANKHINLKKQTKKKKNPCYYDEGGKQGLNAWTVQQVQDDSAAFSLSGTEAAC